MYAQEFRQYFPFLFGTRGEMGFAGIVFRTDSYYISIWQSMVWMDMPLWCIAGVYSQE